MRNFGNPSGELPVVRELALEVYFSRWRSAARHHLTSSDSETLSMGELLNLAAAEDLRRWERLELGYTEPRGPPALRQVIAAASYESVTADHVLCFAGAQEGIFAAMQALLEPHDHAIVITPNYQSTETIPLGRCAVTGVALDPEAGWTLDIDAVAAAIRPNTRLVSINFPNNPTGKILERERFAALIALCRHRGLWLFSDEIYRLIERDPALRLPAAVDAYERGISLGCLSKSYGLPGLRVGWIACRDKALLGGMEGVKHYLSNCVAAPSEFLAELAIKAGDRILARNRLIAGQNLELVGKFFGANAGLFDWHVPDGGVVGYPRYKGSEGVEAFCARLVEEQGVLLLPASIFRSDVAQSPEDRFRIGFGRRDFPTGLAAIGMGLRQASRSLRRAV